MALGAPFCRARTAFGATLPTAKTEAKTSRAGSSDNLKAGAGIGSAVAEPPGMIEVARFQRLKRTAAA